DRGNGIGDEIQRFRSVRAGAGRIIGLCVDVAGGRKIRDAVIGHDVVDRQGDDAGLEEGLVEVGEVVSDDLGAGVGQILNVGGETGFGDVPGSEGEARAWCDVVDDLEHRAALVGAEAAQVLDDLHSRGGQVTCGDVGRGALQGADNRLGDVVITIAQHADLD